MRRGSICQTSTVCPIKNRIDWRCAGRLKERSSCALYNTAYGGNLMFEDRLTCLGVTHNLNLKNCNMTWQKRKCAGLDDSNDTALRFVLQPLVWCSQTRRKHDCFFTFNYFYSSNILRQFASSSEPKPESDLN